MEQLIRSQIHDRDRLETTALRLQRQAEEIGRALRKAKYDLRTTQQNQLLYSGSFRSFLDRLSGKRETAETELRHAVQKAEADLASARRQQEAAEQQLTEIRPQLDALPSWENLRKLASPFPDAAKEWNRLEALYCIEAVLPLLEENRTALLELRDLMRGANAGKIYTFEEQAKIETAPGTWGEACKPFVLRLNAALTFLELPLGSIRYFEAPKGYIVSAAAAHNRRDRLNEALDQVESLLRKIPEIRTQLKTLP